MRCFATIVAVTLLPVGCHSNRGGDDDDDIGDGDADSDSDADADSDVILQVDYAYTTFCEGGGCPTVDHEELVGRNGDAIPALAGAELGLECEIDASTDPPTVTSLVVQDQPIGASPHNGVSIQSGAIHLGSSMSCGEGDVRVFDENEFVGDCAGFTDGSCQILINEYAFDRGRLVLELDCQSLLPVAGSTPRSLQQGLLTIEGCTTS